MLGLLAGIAGSLLPRVLGDVGSNLISNKLISQPNSAMAHEQSKELQKLQQKYNTLNATTAFDRNRQLMWEQFYNETTAYKNRYKMTMDDMNRAGLNPVLAASGGFNVGSGPDAALATTPMASTSGGQGVLPSYPQAGSSALRFAQAGKEVEQTKLFSSEIELKIQQATNTIADTELKRAQQGLVEDQERETVERIKKIQEEILKVIKDRNLTEKNIELMDQQVAKLTEEVKRLVATTPIYVDSGLIYSSTWSKIINWIDSNYSDWWSNVITYPFKKAKDGLKELDKFLESRRIYNE